MTKHIHIHLPPGVTVSQVRTGDSDWDESKHKRDDGGKFSSGGGGGGKSAPIKHASATGQSFLPKQSSVAAGSVVKTGSGFTAKNPQGFKEFFKPHEEAQAKAWAAGAPRKESGTERSYMGKGNHQPGWMLRADPALAAKVKQAQERRAERSAIAKQGPSSPQPWPNNESGNPAPPVGAQVTNPNVGMDGPGVVRSVTGNVATVAYKVKGPDGKVYNRQGEFHVTKLFPVK